MEQDRTALKGFDYAGNPQDSVSTLQSEKISDQELLLKQIAYDEALEIACDWMDATQGDSISIDELKRLYHAGYASYNPEELLDIFDDWNHFQEVSINSYNSPVDKSKEDWDLDQRLYQEARSGLVPLELFLKSESHEVENPKNPSKTLRRYKLTADFAPTDIVLKRYYKYLLAGHLLQERPSEDDVSEERKVNIALGFTLNTGKPLSSFISTIKNSSSEITSEDVLHGAEELEIYDKVFPNSRKEHLDKIVRIGRGPEYHYDLKKKRLVILGRTALCQFEETEGAGYLNWLKTKRKLVIGEVASQSILNSDEGQILSLADLLKDESVLLMGNGKNRNKYRDWPKEMYLQYGKWLMGLVELDAKLIERSHRLGLGPGSDAFSSAKRFGSTSNFFSELGFTNRIPKGQMDSLDEDKIIDYIRLVAQENDGKVNLELLRKYYQSREIKDVPSIWILSKLGHGGISAFIEKAGFKVHNKKLGPDGCLEAVKVFIKNEGRIPTAKDFDRSSDLPSRPTVARYFGGVRGIKSALFEQYSAEELLAA